jgi:hypothetical protein
MERDAYVERIRSDASLGATPEERITTNVARKRNLAVTGGFLALVALVLFFLSRTVRGHLAALLVGNAVLPWVTFAVLAFYNKQADDPGNNRPAFLFMPILIPVITLVMLALDHARLVRSKGVIAWGFAIGVLMLLAGTRMLVNRRKTGSRPGSLIVLMLIFLPYTWVYAGSALALANRTMDVAPPRIVPTRVIGKYLSRGKGGSQYDLHLAGSLPFGNRVRVRVGPYRYWKANNGDVVCVAVHAGKFGYPWVRLVNCPRAAGSRFRGTK